eukprot:392844_1
MGGGSSVEQRSTCNGCSGLNDCNDKCDYCAATSSVASWTDAINMCDTILGDDYCVAGESYWAGYYYRCCKAPHWAGYNGWDWICYDQTVPITDGKHIDDGIDHKEVDLKFMEQNMSFMAEQMNQLNYTVYVMIFVILITGLLGGLCWII